MRRPCLFPAAALSLPGSFAAGISAAHQPDIPRHASPSACWPRCAVCAPSTHTLFSARTISVTALASNFFVANLHSLGTLFCRGIDWHALVGIHWVLQAEMQVGIKEAVRLRKNRLYASDTESVPLAGRHPLLTDRRQPVGNTGPRPAQARYLLLGREPRAVGPRFRTMGRRRWQGMPTRQRRAILPAGRG